MEDFHGQLERDQIRSFQQKNGNFEARTTLTNICKKELIWKKNDVMTTTESHSASRYSKS